MKPSSLVEREREVEALRALLDRARDGDGGVVVVEGPAGIGKTALLEAVAADASAFRVLWGRGGEVERELSFGLVRDLFVPAVRGVSAGQRRRWFAGAAQPAAALLGESRSAAGDPASAMHALYWLLFGMAEERPVALVVDDLQWADSASLHWLAYAARRVEGLPVAMLAATRLVGATDAIGALVGASHRVRALPLAPLSPRAAGAVVAARIGGTPDPAFVRACHAATGGNPWLLRELLEAAADAGLRGEAGDASAVGALGGERLHRAVLARVRRVGRPALELARAVAVLGDGCSLGDAAPLAGLDAAEATRVVPPLIAAAVLADRVGLAFAHSLVRDAVYFDLPAAVRAALHARAAALLAARGAEDELLAGQLLAAAPVGEPWAVAALATAAQTAMARGAPEVAAALLRRALEERPAADLRGELLRTLGNALARLGEPEALTVLEQALQRTQRPADRVAIVEASTDTLAAAGRVDHARRLLIATLVAEQGGDPELVMGLSGRLAMLRALYGDRTGDRWVQALRDHAEELEPGSLAARYAAAALALLGAYCDGTAAEVRRLAWVALGDPERHAADARAGRPLHIALVALALAGEPELALRRADTGIEASRARGSVMGQGFGLAWRSLVHFLAGDVADAETDGRAALAAVADTGLEASALGATAAIAGALLERGEVAAAFDLLDPTPASGVLHVTLSCLRARALLAAHRAREALPVAEAAACEAERAGWRSSCALPWRATLAGARLAVGETASARRLADEELADARRFGAGHEVGRALRLAAAAAREIGGGPRRQEAITLLRETRARLELAYALVDEGAALRRDGERIRARIPLHEGMELAHACGATALRDRARVELRAAGARPRSVVRSGVDALTPSERRIAMLAADGLANREIAQELFVTVRTVEMHLSAAYRKLDITSRAALPAALAPAAPGR